MENSNKQAVFLMLRYIFLVIIAMPNLYMFYLVFTPLTIYASYFLLNLFYDASLSGNTINIGCASIEIIGACVSGAAYYLLLILNLSIPNIKIKKRIKMILFCFAIFFLANLMRILILGVMHINSIENLELYHKILWYAGSTLLIVLIWFANIKLFKIKSIPFYSDFKFLYSKSSLNSEKEN